MSIDPKQLAEWKALAGREVKRQGLVSSPEEREFLRVAEVAVPALIAEVEATRAFIATLPLSIREIARLEGPGMALREWHRRGDAFIEQLQAERDNLRKQVEELEAGIADGAWRA